MPQTVLDASFDAFEECGCRRRECVVFWATSVDGDRVETAVHPVHRSTASFFEVDSEWVTRFWLQLERERRSVRAQIHTHPGVAFHSPTDDEGAIAGHEGFVSIVVPDFGRHRSLELARAYQITVDGWHEVPSVSAVVRVV